MNISTYLNAIIREAVKVWIIQHEISAWPESVLNFQGVSDFLSFEEGRDDFVAPTEGFLVKKTLPAE